MPQTPNLEIPTLVNTQNNMDVTHNDALIDIDQVLTRRYGPAAPGVLATEDALRNMFFVFNGAGTATFPANVRWYMVQTTSPTTTLAITGGGPTFALSDTDWHLVYYDGTAWNEILTGGGTGGITTIAAATDTNIVAPTAGQILEWDGVSAWANVTPAAGATPKYDVGLFYSGTPEPNATVLRMRAVRAFTINLTTDVSRGSVGTNPSINTVFSVKRDGSEVGTFTVSNTGVFTFSPGSGQAFTAGQVLTVVSPVTLNGLADLGVVFSGVED